MSRRCCRRTLAGPGVSIVGILVAVAWLGRAAVIPVALFLVALVCVTLEGRRP